MAQSFLSHKLCSTLDDDDDDDDDDDNDAGRQTSKSICFFAPSMDQRTAVNGRRRGSATNH